jgi:hypothetical protein
MRPLSHLLLQAELALAPASTMNGDLPFLQHAGIPHARHRLELALPCALLALSSPSPMASIRQRLSSSSAQAAASLPHPAGGARTFPFGHGVCRPRLTSLDACSSGHRTTIAARVVLKLCADSAAPARRHCGALAPRPSGFGVFTFVVESSNPVLPCPTSSSPFWWSSSRPGFWHVSLLAVEPGFPAQPSQLARRLSSVVERLLHPGTLRLCSTKSPNESSCHRLHRMEIAVPTRRLRRSFPLRVSNLCSRQKSEKIRRRRKQISTRPENSRCG